MTRTELMDLFDADMLQVIEHGHVDTTRSRTVEGRYLYANTNWLFEVWLKGYETGGPQEELRRPRHWPILDGPMAGKLIAHNGDHFLAPHPDGSEVRYQRHRLAPERMCVWAKDISSSEASAALAKLITGRMTC